MKISFNKKDIQVFISECNHEVNIKNNYCEVCGENAKKSIHIAKLVNILPFTSIIISLVYKCRIIISTYDNDRERILFNINGIKTNRIKQIKTFEFSKYQSRKKLINIDAYESSYDDLLYIVISNIGTKCNHEVNNNFCAICGRESGIKDEDFYIYPYINNLGKNWAHLKDIAYAMYKKRNKSNKQHQYYIVSAKKRIFTDTQVDCFKILDNGEYTEIHREWIDINDVL